MDLTLTITDRSPQMVAQQMQLEDGRDGMAASFCDESHGQHVAGYFNFICPVFAKIAQAHERDNVSHDSINGNELLKACANCFIARCPQSRILRGQSLVPDYK